jgi:hypothetical protein
MNNWYEKEQELRKIINKYLEDLVDKNSTKIKGWILVVVKDVKAPGEGLVCTILGHDIQHLGIVASRSEMKDKLIKFVSSCAWFEEKDSRGDE